MNPLANFVTPDAGTSHYSIPPLINVNPDIYPSPPAPMPPGGVYTYPYMSLPIIPNPPITQMDNNPATIFIQSLPLQSSKELKEEERNKLDMMKQFEGGNTQQKVNLIKERLKAIEGNSSIKGLDVNELSLVLDVVIPHKFKTPDFVKYNGSTCPRAHMIMFCRKMVGHTGNDKLLIHCFQESLTRSAAKWYMKLDRNQIHTWTNLMKAFLAQYDHVVDTTLDHMALMTMEKKEIESFKEYTHGWKDIASQV